MPSFTLGVADVSPLEMASAYATFAARGEHCDARPVTQILNSDGKVFKNYPKKCKQVMQESTADTVNDILRGVMAPGGFGQALALNKPSAGKTGTIHEQHGRVVQRLHPDARDGGDDRRRQLQGPADHPERPSVGGAHRRSGVRLDRRRADVGRRDARGPGRPARRDFTAPDQAPSAGPIEVEIPDVAGMSTERAARAARRRGFYVSTGERRESDERRGTVAETEPSAGDRATRGSTVYVYPSSVG